MFNWAAGWIYARGCRIKFNEDFLDVAVKIAGTVGGEIGYENGIFLYTVDRKPHVESADIDFVRGAFEASGLWGRDVVFIPSPDDVNIEPVVKPFSPAKTTEGFFITGSHMDKFLHVLYDAETEARSDAFFKKFLSYIHGENWNRSFIDFHMEEEAVYPFKKRISDTGWDLFLIKLIEKKGNFYFYDTGIKVKPPRGYYLDLVPRSSLPKYGFMLANSVGVIDMTYRGTIKVPLFKFDSSKPDPRLPWRAVQLIPRRYYPLEMRKVDALDDTERGEGGFGSTG